MQDAIPIWSTEDLSLEYTERLSISSNHGQRSAKPLFDSSSLTLCTILGTDKLYVSTRQRYPFFSKLTNCVDHSQRVGLRRCILSQRRLWNRKVEGTGCYLQAPPLQFLRGLPTAVQNPCLYGRGHSLRY